jgi:hypothetical protein
MNSNFEKSRVLDIMSGICLGISLSYLGYKILGYFKNMRNSRENSRKTRTTEEISLNADQATLIREQLKRNYEFFKEEGMKKIINSYVIVVGIGGVGR